MGAVWGASVARDGDAVGVAVDPWFATVGSRSICGAFFDQGNATTLRQLQRYFTERAR
jgi:hypothetical protein